MSLCINSKKKITNRILSVYISKWLYSWAFASTLNGNSFCSTVLSIVVLIFISSWKFCWRSPHVYLPSCIFFGVVCYKYFVLFYWVTSFSHFLFIIQSPNNFKAAKKVHLEMSALCHSQFLKPTHSVPPSTKHKMWKCVYLLAFFFSIFCPISPTSLYSNHTCFEFFKYAVFPNLKIWNMFILLKHLPFLYILYFHISITASEKLSLIHKIKEIPHSFIFSISSPYTPYIILCCHLAYSVIIFLRFAIFV